MHLAGFGSGRIGYAWERTLLYATGGVAFTDINAFTNWIPIGIFPGTITSQTKNLAGATVGAGVEHAITDSFTVGIEGRYTWYGSRAVVDGIHSGNPCAGHLRFRANDAQC
jgi:outer membrane immunogenic protein